MVVRTPADLDGLRRRTTTREECLAYIRDSIAAMRGDKAAAERVAAFRVRLAQEPTEITIRARVRDGSA